LLVTDVGRSKRTALRQATENLSWVDANLVGVILNRASPGETGYYAYQYHIRTEQGSGKAKRDSEKAAVNARALTQRSQKTADETESTSLSEGHAQAKAAAPLPSKVTAKGGDGDRRSDSGSHDRSRGSDVPIRTQRSRVQK
jgi:hypothetical protein